MPGPYMLLTYVDLRSFADHMGINPSVALHLIDGLVTTKCIRKDQMEANTDDERGYHELVAYYHNTAPREHRTMYPLSSRAMIIATECDPLAFAKDTGMKPSYVDRVVQACTNGLVRLHMRNLHPDLPDYPPRYPASARSNLDGYDNQD